MVSLQLFNDFSLLIEVPLVLLHDLFVRLHQRGSLDHVCQHARVVVHISAINGICSNGGLTQQFIVDGWVQLDGARELLFQVGN